MSFAQAGHLFADRLSQVYESATMQVMLIHRE